MCLAVPGKVIIIHDEDPMQRMASVEFGGVSKEISLALVPEAQVGDYVIVHVGVAISVIDEEEALITLDYFRQIEALHQQ
jgi:hydrogenase expression/formation protein HypC